MGSLRQMLARELAAPSDAAALIDYSGIDPDSPIALGSWTADQAQQAGEVAQRDAIVLRVKDRDRFERTVAQLQRNVGSFADFTTYVAGAARGAAALPALLPLTAQSMLSFKPTKGSSGPLLTYEFIGEEEWNGLRIKTIEHRWLIRTGRPTAQLPDSLLSATRW